MRNTILSILFLGGIFGGSPSVPEQAAEEHDKDNFATATELFKEALDLEDYMDQKQALNFNIGQGLIGMDSLTRARTWFSKAIGPKNATDRPDHNPQVASWAYNNVAVVQVKTQESVQVGGSSPMAVTPSLQGGGEAGKDQIQEALSSLREALRLHPDNDIARYNYELLMRRIQQQTEQQQEQEQNDDNQQEDQQDEDKENQQKEQQQKENEQDNQQDQKKENQPQPDNQENKGQNNPQQQDNKSTSDNMDEKQARRLLEAVSEKEKQFIQELEERQPKGRPRKTDGPDW